MLGKNNKNENAQSSALNMIGVGTIINGHVNSDGDLRIDGSIEGNVNTKSKIATGQTSHITGNVKARSADISGKITGDIEISETLFLRASSKVIGNIKTGKIIIESGAEFNGKCSMNHHEKQTSIETQKES